MTKNYPAQNIHSGKAEKFRVRPNKNLVGAGGSVTGAVCQEKAVKCWSLGRSTLEEWAVEDEVSGSFSRRSALCQAPCSAEAAEGGQPTL